MAACAATRVGSICTRSQHRASRPTQNRRDSERDAVWKKKRKKKKKQRHGVLTGRRHGGVSLDRASQTDRRGSNDNQELDGTIVECMKETLDMQMRFSNNGERNAWQQREREGKSVHRFIFSCFCSVRIFLRR